MNDIDSEYLYKLNDLSTRMQISPEEIIYCIHQEEIRNPFIYDMASDEEQVFKPKVNVLQPKRKPRK